MGLDITITSKKHTEDFRKRNFLITWVEKVRNGEVENCETYSLEKEQLESLLADIDRVLEDNSLAEELLPTCEGFFFGNTKYDDYYFADLRDARERIGQMVADMEDGETADFWSWW